MAKSGRNQHAIKAFAQCDQSNMESHFLETKGRKIWKLISVSPRLLERWDWVVVKKNISGSVLWIRIHKGFEPFVVCSTFLFLVPRSKKGHLVLLNINKLI